MTNWKSHWVAIAYEKKKQLHGGFKIVEYSELKTPQGMQTRKRTLYKNLDLSTAESVVYRLENSL